MRRRRLGRRAASLLDRPAQHRRPPVANPEARTILLFRFRCSPDQAGSWHRSDRARSPLLLPRGGGSGSCGAARESIAGTTRLRRRGEQGLQSLPLPRPEGGAPPLNPARRPCPRASPACFLDRFRCTLAAGEAPANAKESRERWDFSCFSLSHEPRGAKCSLMQSVACSRDA